MAGERREEGKEGGRAGENVKGIRKRENEKERREGRKRGREKKRRQKERACKESGRAIHQRVSVVFSSLLLPRPDNNRAMQRVHLDQVTVRNRSAVLEAWRRTRPRRRREPGLQTRTAVGHHCQSSKLTFDLLFSCEASIAASQI